MAAINGYELARRYGVTVVLGPLPQYRWAERRIVLPREVALGTSPWALLIAAHEIGHHLQPRFYHYLRVFDPFRWWYERDAWLRAEAILRDL